ncbi:MAG: lamin tail domain-containing protein [Kofleriaceae bacterium]
MIGAAAATTMTAMTAMTAIAAVAIAVAGCGPSAPTTGCRDSILPGDLVITEVFADYVAPMGSSGVDDGKEWFEIYNASDEPIELDGLTIVHSRPDGTKPSSHEVGSVTIAPGQFLTLGNSAKDLLPPYIDYGYMADLGELYNSNGGMLALSCSDTEIDRAIYDTVKPGHSRELTSAQPPDYTLNDNAVNWCQANDTEFDNGNFGTPGADNDCLPIVMGQCNDGDITRDVMVPTAGSLVITEVMPSPDAVSDTVGEWFEVKALAPVDLNGIGLDRVDDNLNPVVLTSNVCMHLEPGDYAVFAASLDSLMNGGLEVAGKFNFTLVGGSASEPGDVRITAGSTIVDSITWTSARNGKSLALDPDLTDATANDVEANLCDGETVYNTAGDPPKSDYGTPGAQNDQCPTIAPPDMCDDGGLRAIAKPAAGQLVITEVLPNPGNCEGCSDSTREWFEITNIGPGAFDLNGLGLARPGMTANVINSTPCLSIPEGGYALFARSKLAAENGGLPAVDATFTFNLVDSSGSSVEVRDGDAVLDVITWTSATSGVSKQLDPDQFTTTANDMTDNFCVGAAPYGDGTNMGTPRSANAQCPP